MKHSRISFILFFIIISIALLAETESTQSKPVIIATPTPAPTPTPTPQSPTPTPTNNIALDYDQVSIDEGNDTTTLVLAVKATYNFGGSISLNYQDFVLNILRPRGGLAPAEMLLHTSDAKPLETGSVTIDSGNRAADFTLTFNFATMQSGFEGPIKFSSTRLVYSGNLPVYTSPPPSPTPTVPELSWLAIIPLLIPLISAAMVFRNRAKH